MALRAEGERVVEFVEVTETATTGCFEDPSGLFAAFFQLPFPDVIVEVSFISDRFVVRSS